MPPQRLLFVCLGNICRSPMAQGVFEAAAQTAGRAEAMMVDSAGTGNWHVDAPPDPRAVAATAARGVDISGQRARQVTIADFARFDAIFAMDADNLRALQALAERASPPKATLARVLDLTPAIEHRNVPDPYYGGAEGFDFALDLLEATAEAFFNAAANPR